MRIITTENASKYTTFDQIFSYYLIAESFIDNKLMISVIRDTMERMEFVDSKVMFTRPFEKIPKEWLKSIEININFNIQDGKLFVGHKRYTIKKVFRTKELHPLFDETGKYYGSDEIYQESVSFLGQQTKKIERKVATYTLEKRPEALLWLITIQGVEKRSEKKLATKEILEKYNIPKRDVEYWAIPIYINGHLSGARIMYDQTPAGNFRQLCDAITLEDFLALK